VRSFGAGRDCFDLRFSFLAGAVIAAAAAAFGIVHDYGYLHASILTGSREGWLSFSKTLSAGVTAAAESFSEVTGL